MAADVEGQQLGEPPDLRVLVGLTCCRQLVERLVGALDIGGVMFRMMELEQLRRDRRLQRRIVIRQVGELIRARHASVLPPHGYDVTAVDVVASSGWTPAAPRDRLRITRCPGRRFDTPWRARSNMKSEEN